MSQLVRKTSAHSTVRVLSHSSLNTKVAGLPEGFKPKSGFLYTVTRAISARVNQNFDGFPPDELRKAAHTFVGKPLFVNHHNENPEEARGVVVGARFVANGDDKYIEVIQEVDSSSFPKLAREIINGGLDSVSMGCEAGFTICSYCDNRATDMDDMCEHVLYHKGEYLPRTAANGETEPVLVYESCHDVKFFELSYVFDPADETAVVSKVLTASRKTAYPETQKCKFCDAQATERVIHSEGNAYVPCCDDHEAEAEEAAATCTPDGSKDYDNIDYIERIGSVRRRAFGEIEAPTEVDTLRDEENDEEFKHYVESPEELQDPDLDEAKRIDRVQDTNPGLAIDEDQEEDPSLMGRNQQYAKRRQHRAFGDDLQNGALNDVASENPFAEEDESIHPRAAKRRRANSTHDEYKDWLQSGGYHPDKDFGQGQLQENFLQDYGYYNDGPEAQALSQSYGQSPAARPGPKKRGSQVSRRKFSNDELKDLAHSFYRNIQDWHENDAGRETWTNPDHPDFDWDQAYDDFSGAPEGSEDYYKFNDATAQYNYDPSYDYIRNQNKGKHRASKLIQVKLSAGRHRDKSWAEGDENDYSPQSDPDHNEWNDFGNDPDFDYDNQASGFHHPSGDVSGMINYHGGNPDHDEWMQDTDTPQLHNKWADEQYGDYPYSWSIGDPDDHGTGQNVWEGGGAETSWDAQAQANAAMDRAVGGEHSVGMRSDEAFNPKDPKWAAASTQRRAQIMRGRLAKMKKASRRRTANDNWDAIHPELHDLAQVAWELGVDPSSPEAVSEWAHAFEPDPQTLQNVQNLHQKADWKAFGGQTIPAEEMAPGLQRQRGANKGTSRTRTVANRRGGTTARRESMAGQGLATRGRVAARGRFADQSRNDQGEQEEAFISQTPEFEEATDEPTDVSQENGALVARRRKANGNVGGWNSSNGIDGSEGYDYDHGGPEDTYAWAGDDGSWEHGSTGMYGGPHEQGKANSREEAQGAAAGAYHKFHGSKRTQAKTRRRANDVEFAEPDATTEVDDLEGRTDPRGPNDSTLENVIARRKRQAKAYRSFEAWVRRVYSKDIGEAKSRTELRLWAERYTRQTGSKMATIMPSLRVAAKAIADAEGPKGKEYKGDGVLENGKNRTARRRRVAGDVGFAEPDDRVDVEKPVSGTTDDEAQASQFDERDFGDNAGDDIANPDLSTDQNWSPGKAATRQVASGTQAMRLAEAMIEAGVEPADRRWLLAEQFEKMNQGQVLDRIALLGRVINANKTRVAASGVSRGATRSIVPPNLGRVAGATRPTSTSDASHDIDMFL